jgi:hypothetical protein
VTGIQYERGIGKKAEVGWYVAYTDGQQPTRSYWVRDRLLYRVGIMNEGSFLFVPPSEFNMALEEILISSKPCGCSDALEVKEAILDATDKWNRERNPEVYEMPQS